MVVSAPLRARLFPFTPACRRSMRSPAPERRGRGERRAESRVEIGRRTIVDLSLLYHRPAPRKQTALCGAAFPRLGDPSRDSGSSTAFPEVACRSVSGKAALVRSDRRDAARSHPRHAAARAGRAAAAARAAASRHRALRPRGLRRAAGAGDAGAGRARPRSRPVAQSVRRPRRAVRRRSVRRLARGAGGAGRRRRGADRRRARHRSRRGRSRAARPHLRHRHAGRLRHHRRHGDPGGDRAGRRPRLRHRRQPDHRASPGCLGRHRRGAGRARCVASRRVRAAHARAAGRCRTRGPSSTGSTRC